MSRLSRACSLDEETVDKAVDLLTSWGKKIIQPKDTPGFLVSRITRPYFREASQILEENMGDPPTIDWAMKKIGGFEAGPFELIDQIGNDINYRVTKSIFEGLYFDPRYTPSISQKRMVEAGLLGKKAGKGFYEYGKNAALSQPTKNEVLGNEIFQRVLVMLINGAVETLWKGIGTADEIELAAIYGARYPKGLLSWCDEIGLQKILDQLESLQSRYSQERYRPSPLIKRMAHNGETFSEKFSGI
ncbi:MAG: 3-hydroxyacyl-CoA dehydrogenase family protein [Balneolaceae bacterium]|nr:3-hydroxyacyl-CoA dehydrogenase family protein [Balneolaceae bacterium]